MGSYYYVDLSFLKLFQNAFLIGRLPVPAYIINFTGESLKPRCECLIMLEGQNCCWHKDGCLLAVGS